MEYISNVLALFVFLLREVTQAFIAIVGLVLAGGVFGGIIYFIKRLFRGLINEEK